MAGKAKFWDLKQLEINETILKFFEELNREYNGVLRTKDDIKIIL